MKRESDWWYRGLGSEDVDFFEPRRIRAEAMPTMEASELQKLVAFAELGMQVSHVWWERHLAAREEAAGILLRNWRRNNFPRMAAERARRIIGRIWNKNMNGRAEFVRNGS